MTSLDRNSDLMKLALINLPLNCRLKRTGGNVALLAPVPPEGEKMACIYIYSGNGYLLVTTP